MAHKEQITKTNAARLLDELGISYSIHESEVDLSDLSAVSMAKKIGADPLRVFKTLVARGDKTGVIMACLPGSGELDLKALAKASDNKHVEMVHLKEVQPLTGYVRGGCSPLAARTVSNLSAYPGKLSGLPPCRPEYNSRKESLSASEATRWRAVILK